VGAEYGDIRPLDQARIQRLSVNGVHLVDIMDSHNAFVAELASKECITMPQREHLMNIAQPRDRNNKLLELVSAEVSPISINSQQSCPRNKPFWCDFWSQTEVRRVYCELKVLINLKLFVK